MKNTLDTMKEILSETYKQIEDNLPSGEYLISYLTIYDKKNAVSTNIFLTSQAIFLQESNEIDTIKKRRFNKISDIKLTNTEFYIEFINGYVIIGDISQIFLEAEKFFNEIKANTKIKASSVKDLNTVNTNVEKPNVPRHNPFMNDGKRNTVTATPPKTQSLVDSYTQEEQEVKPKTNAKKIIIILSIILVVLALGGVLTAVLVNKSNEEKAKKELENKITSIEVRAEELLQYQVANNEFYDYIFTVQDYYDEISETQATINLSEYELGLRDLQNDFEDKYEKEFKAKSDAYALYKTAQIDEWMNNNRKYVEDTFDLFSDCLDGNFKSETKMLELKKLLADADSEIRKVQSILAEEKDELKKAYSQLTGKDYVAEDGSNVEKELKTKDTKDSKTTKNSKDSDTDDEKETESDNKTTTKTKDKDKENQETVNPNADEDGFVDESNKNSAGAATEEEQGRQDDAAYTG